jgi:hypothetical protein
MIKMQGRFFDTCRLSSGSDCCNTLSQHCSGRRIAGGVDRQYGIAPLLAAEVEVDLNTQQALRLCGGYPLSYLAGSDKAAFQWRQDFIAT